MGSTEVIRCTVGTIMSKQANCSFFGQAAAPSAKLHQLRACPDTIHITTAELTEFLESCYCKVCNITTWPQPMQLCWGSCSLAESTAAKVLTWWLSIWFQKRFKMCNYWMLIAVNIYLLNFTFKASEKIPSFDTHTYTKENKFHCPCEYEIHE